MQKTVTDWSESQSPGDVVRRGKLAVRTGISLEAGWNESEDHLEPTCSFEKKILASKRVWPSPQKLNKGFSFVEMVLSVS